MSKSLFTKRMFGSSATASGRLRKGIELRPPIPPSAENVKVKEDHPLWQFFSNKKFMRDPDELQEAGEYIK